MVEKRLGREIVLIPVPSGKEICEKQLFHFVDTVERVEIDSQQIESFLPKVYKKLSWLTREELIQRFVSVEFNRFLNYYRDNRDLESVKPERRERKPEKVVFKKFRLSIGANHGLSKRELMRLINRLRVTRSIEIGRIDIFDNHSFVELDGQFESSLIKGLSRTKYKGLAIKVSLA